MTFLLSHEGAAFCADGCSPRNRAGRRFAAIMVARGERLPGLGGHWTVSCATKGPRAQCDQQPPKLEITSSSNMRERLVIVQQPVGGVDAMMPVLCALSRNCAGGGEEGGRSRRRGQLTRRQQATAVDGGARFNDPRSASRCALQRGLCNVCASSERRFGGEVLVEALG